MQAWQDILFTEQRKMPIPNVSHHTKRELVSWLEAEIEKNKQLSEAIKHLLHMAETSTIGSNTRCNFLKKIKRRYNLYGIGD